MSIPETITLTREEVKELLGYIHKYEEADNDLAIEPRDFWYLDGDELALLARTTTLKVLPDNNQMYEFPLDIHPAVKNSIVWCVYYDVPWEGQQLMRLFNSFEAANNWLGNYINEEMKRRKEDWIYASHEEGWYCENGDGAFVQPRIVSQE